MVSNSFCLASLSFDTKREVLMHRLVYRNERVWGSFTSRIGDDDSTVNWFQLGWVAPTETLAAHFVLLQEGSLYSEAVARWNPSITVNSHGTVVLGFLYTTVATQLVATSRLDNDPVGEMRDEVVIAEDVESTGFGSLSSRPGAFYVSAADATYELFVEGDIIRRVWVAEDLCNVTSCIQIIVEQ